MKQQLIDTIKGDKLCFKTGDFTLASGLKSNIYCDMSRVLSAYQGLKRVTKMMAEGFNFYKYNQIGGIGYGSFPLVVTLSQLFEVDYFMYRSDKENKLEGQFSIINRTVLIEDVVSTGGSILKVVNEIRQRGGHVEQVICVLDRKLGGRERLAAANVDFGYLLTIDDLGIKDQ